MLPVEWKRVAYADLWAIIDYISDDNLEAAQALQNELAATVEPTDVSGIEIAKFRAAGKREISAQGLFLYKFRPRKAVFFLVARHTEKCGRKRIEHTGSSHFSVQRSHREKDGFAAEIYRETALKELAVSIGSIDSTAWSPPVLSSPEEKGEREAPSASALTRLTDTAGFATVAPRIQAVLAQMDVSGEENVVERLSDNVSRLQDGFVDALYATLSGRGVDLSSKMTLKLDNDAQLRVAGEHPEKDRIDAALAEAPELSAAFSEISSQSSALRDIRSLHSTVLQGAGLTRYAALAGSGDGYQISLKGDMNHFYFSR